MLYLNKIKKIIALTSIGLMLPVFILAQESSQINVSGPPKTLQEAKTIDEKVFGAFPQAFKEACQKAVAFWQEMLNYVRNFFTQQIWPKIQSKIDWLTQKIQPIFQTEIEKRKPFIEKEFEKEKEEMIEELPKVSKPLWERFKELIK